MTSCVAFQGKVKGKDAAVKVVRIKKPNAGEKPRTEEETMQMQQRGAMDMRKEIIAMEELASFGGHPNLIKLIGFDKSESEPLLVRALILAVLPRVTSFCCLNARLPTT